MSRYAFYGLLLLPTVLAAGLLSLGLIDAPPPGLENGVIASAPRNLRQSRSVATLASPPLNTGLSGFDVALIDPNGTSVFAGRSSPGSWVTVLADGQPIAAVQSDTNGEWTLVTDRKLPATPQLSISTGVAPSVQSPTRVAELTGGRAPEPSVALSSQVAAVSRDIVKRVESLVASARVADRAGGQSATPTNLAPVQTSGAEPVPVPILFRFREARFTEEGQKSVELLAQYLRLTHCNLITLTGHADERGTADLNMDLSDQRLKAVWRFLRRAGYAGQVQLLPKGKSEPFAGVDRSKFPAEVLWQLDRRVELIARAN